MAKGKYKYHYFYKIINLINNHFYYGIHSTNNLDDGYMGSGVYLKEDQLKYGLDKFKKDILFECQSREELSNKEAELVDDECSVTSSGEIKYVDVEVDDNQIVTKAGNIVFIPEEVHQINKDSSLKMVENGTFVTAGTEVVKDVWGKEHKLSDIDIILEYLRRDENTWLNGDGE